MSSVAGEWPTGSFPRDESLPRAFGRYVLFDHIGKGGLADIYLARAHAELGGGRLAVVKQILPELTGDPKFSRLLVGEAKLSARLNHANVVQVFDLGEEGGRLYIAMEYVEGFDLHQLLRRMTRARIPLPAEFVVFMIREILRALDYAHRACTEDGVRMDIVHRDVSPTNVLVSFEGEVKLCDFGIARALGLAHRPGEGEVARSHGIAGKGAYMSPEQARGQEIDARADVFVVGVLLWELCAGRRLYRGSKEEVLQQAQQAQIPPLPDRGLPRQEVLRGILERALAPRLVDRYQSAQEMLRSLETYALEAGLGASQLKFGAFLTEHFADEIVDIRRQREHSAETALETGDVNRAGEQDGSGPVHQVATAELSAVSDASAIAHANAEPTVIVEDDSSTREGAKARKDRLQAATFFALGLVLFVATIALLGLW